MGIKIALKPVTVNNWKASIALELGPDQQNFVSSNLYSIAEAQFYPDAKFCYQESNKVARTLYAELGFVEQETSNDGKVTALLEMNPSKGLFS